MDHKQNTHGFIRQSYDMVQSGEDYLATLIGVLTFTRIYYRILGDIIVINKVS